MKINEKYSYSKYRNNDARPTGSAKVFVAPKLKYQYNPIVNLPAKLWGNVGIVILIFVTLWAVFYSPYFRIKEVIVEGNSLASKEKIATAGGLGQNIFNFNSRDAKEQIIQSSPIIEDVVIYRGIPDALKIVVLERKPQIVWQSADGYYLVDNQGIADKVISAEEYVELSRISDRKNMKVKIGAQIASKEFVEFAKKLSEQFFNSTNIKITGYYVEETTFDLYVQTEAGFVVKFDTTRQVEKQLEDLKNIIIAYRPNIKEYVDVRINGWAYYK